ncbi:universal stress protein [Myxococcaceae bacterium GXIMD 01537]
MAIACPTNLSEPSLRAGTLAAALARRLGEPLWLLGVTEAWHPSAVPPEAQAALEAEAVRLRGEGAEVHARQEGGRLEAGRLEEGLVGDEAPRPVRLWVLASEGWPAPTALRRAPLSERLARLSSAPVLVVRDAGGLLGWARGLKRPRVLVGMDLGPSSDAAVAFLRELRRVGPCDVLATYVCSPAEERQRLGIHTPVHVEMLDPVVRHIEALDPQAERVLRREVLERLGPLPGEGEVEAVLEPGYGRLADHLLHVAHARAVDLVVVGTHQRRGLQRLWHGSVSAGVLRHAEQSVVCVPPAPAGVRRARAPRTVLVPVDFTEGSVRAIAQARSLVGPGGRVHLLHVHPQGAAETAWDWYGVVPEPPRERDAVLRRLWALVPREEGGAVRWTVEGVSGGDVARAICQATEREGVDLVCVAAPEEDRRAGMRGGTLARALVERCRRPVMVVPVH